MRYKVSLIFSILWLLSSTCVFAQSRFPQPSEKYVNDFAAVLDSADAQTIRTALQELEKQVGIEATVVTIGSMRDYGDSGDAIESFATAWFNSWGIGDGQKNNGALILVAINDRKMRIEVGSGFGSTYDGRLKRIIDEKMTPDFRNGNYSLGIAKGAIAMATLLGGEQYEPKIDVAALQPKAPLIPWAGKTVLGVLGGMGVAAAAAGTYGWRYYQRNRPRMCSQCNLQMERLGENDDDDFLDKGQQREELLGSVDYDVLKCPGCGKYELHRYPAFITVYKSCPQCGYRSLHSNSTTVQEPTRYAQGRREVRQDCEHCNFSHVEMMAIAMLSDNDNSSSSSSSSSSTGGRSSGGGASGSW